MSETNFDLQLYAAKARQAVAEGVVLLKNDCNVLPLAPGGKVALFGRSQFNYYKSGTGSGGWSIPNTLLALQRLWKVKKAMRSIRR
ncbi:glycoside hydrolase family 3 C-terminal domain-containing protein [Paenibacillus sonchi]|uniref:glycoside hydrolase family 3 C-terminal domain-containing protein n=1 Tax=Paenibacillus sonchi TaxID=373687 RepID=UPI001F347761|nr:glycoside hydrolase family 3 C-terminal domain-containing protein [Paenibacillus sonchi]